MKRCKGCGVTKPRSSFYRQPRMKDGLYSQCKSCAAAYTKAQRKKIRTENPWLHFFRRAKERAKARGIPFEITMDWVRENASDVCPYTGIPFRFTPPKDVEKLFGLDPCQPTFERTDSTKGYTPENTEIISWRINYFKGKRSAEELEWLCHCVLDRIKEADGDN